MLSRKPISCLTIDFGSVRLVFGLGDQLADMDRLRPALPVVRTPARRPLTGPTPTNRLACQQMGNEHMPCSVQFSEYGDTDVLRVVDVHALSPGPGQVRIVVRAAGINPVDWKTMRGDMREAFPLTLPMGLGTDVSCVVDEVGAAVTEFGVGDAVM